MESPAERSGSRASIAAAGRRSSVSGRRRVAEAPLEVSDVVQHGTGRGSRIDLTIVVAGREVRLSGLRAKHALSYVRIEESSIEAGVVLPCLRSANRVWREALSAAMEHARIEPLLEGEEIADAVAAEIRASLELRDRGDGAGDLIAGKVVELGDRLLVSPKALVEAVRSRLADDVLPQATIAEAAAAQLGMRQSRPRFAGARIRPRAWAFPRPLPPAREDGEGNGPDEYTRVEGVAGTDVPDPASEPAARPAAVASVDGRHLRDISRADSHIRWTE